MEEKETKNKFWKGVLVGVLVTAFSGLAVVGVATGIWTVGRRASESQSTQTAETSGAQLDMNKITPKLQYMETLIDKYFLFACEQEVLIDQCLHILKLRRDLVHIQLSAGCLRGLVCSWLSDARLPTVQIPVATPTTASPENAVTRTPTRTPFQNLFFVSFSSNVFSPSSQGSQISSDKNCARIFM